MFSDSLPEELPGIARADRSSSRLQDRVAQLFEESRGDVYRYLLILGLYPPQAQEATQEVFLRLYLTLRRNQEVENPRAWIFRVAHNLGLKIRSKQAEQQPFDPELEARLMDPQSTPEMTVLERERRARFHRAIENLSEQQRRCLFLRLEGLRYPEIGAVLGISASAVGEFMRRAMVKLKRLRDE
jgi:RNA polymerase sigma-70 factor (ECF subfamily)